MKHVSCYVLLLACTGLAAQPSEKLDLVLRTYADRHLFSGTALVLHQGETLLLRGYGYQDVTTRTLNSSQTAFQVGSLTKQFTAAMVLMLQQEGRLRLTDPLSLYLPSYPAGDRITLHHLLSHTSGVYNYTDDAAFMQAGLEAPRTRAEMLALFAEKPLIFEPGTRMAYSNSGYLLLGYVIEEVTRLPYAAALEQYILEPLGMSASGFAYASIPAACRATGYHQLDETDSRPAVPVHPSVSGGGGALCTTAPDLLRWHQALMGHRLLSRKSQALAFTAYLEGFGYGWVTDTMAGHPAVYHNGSIPGFTANIYRIPEDNTCIILLANQATGVIDKLTQTLLAVLYDLPYELPRQVHALDRLQAQACLGVYPFNPDFQLEIFFVGKSLYARQTGDVARFELFSAGDSIYFLQAFEAELVFSGYETGHYRQLALHQRGEVITAPLARIIHDSTYQHAYRLDSMLTSAIHGQDTGTLAMLLAPDIQYDDDQAGRLTALAATQLLAGGLRRETPVWEAYMMPGGSLLVTGTHRLYAPAHEPAYVSGFAHTWEQRAGRWVLTRVAHYGH